MKQKYPCMVSRILGLILAGGLLISSVGCAANRRPVLYPNEHLQAVGDEAARRDIEECLRLSAQVRDTGSAAKVAGSTAVGAAGGAAVGAATGAFWESAASGAAGGAAGGATSGLLFALFRARDLDPVQAAFVEECLRQKGYRVIGWR
jgi:outer membrane lipoprotein SlyB